MISYIPPVPPDRAFSGVPVNNLRVPPPYVPPLGNGTPALAGPAGYVFTPPADTPISPAPRQPEKPSVAPLQASAPQPQEAESTTYFHLPHWLILSIRERILLGLLLLSLIMVPASLPQASVDARGFNPSDPNLQSVERAEENFAGSAFYFIDPGYAIPQNYGNLPVDPLAHPGDGSLDGLDTDPLTGLPVSNHAASPHMIQPVSFRGSVTDNSRSLQCLGQAIYYEAGMEPDAGQRAVAQVILNRVRHPSYPGTVCGVIYQGSERQTGCQFSYTCDGSLRRKPSKFHWNRSMKVAAAALAGKINSTVGTATHYHATYVYPYWAPSLKFLGTIGAHRFYSWKGKAGRASAFNQLYRGGEPLPAPKPRRYDADYAKASAKSLDPIALEKAYETALQKARIEAARMEKATAVAADNARRHDLPAPQLNVGKANSYQAPRYSKEAQARGGEKAFAGQKLPDVSQIKPEFQNSGTWKKKPGG